MLSHESWDFSISYCPVPAWGVMMEHDLDRMFLYNFFLTKILAHGEMDKWLKVFVRIKQRDNNWKRKNEGTTVTVSSYVAPQVHYKWKLFFV